MSVLLQWIIVGIVVAGALTYLVKQMTKSTKGKCSSCCGCKNNQSPEADDCSNCSDKKS